MLDLQCAVPHCTGVLATLLCRHLPAGRRALARVTMAASALVTKLCKIFNEASVSKAELAAFRRDNASALRTKPLTGALPRRLMSLLVKEGKACPSADTFQEFLQIVGVMCENGTTFRAMLDEMLAKRANEVRATWLCCVGAWFHRPACPLQIYNAISMSKDMSEDAVIQLCDAMLKWMATLVRVVCVPAKTSRVCVTTAGPLASLCRWTSPASTSKHTRSSWSPCSSQVRTLTGCRWPTHA